MHNRSGLKKALSLLSILILVSIIFYSSLHSGYDSNEASKKVALFIADAVSGILNLPTVEPNSELFDIINTVVRKSAHFMEYFFLCILIYFFFKKFDMSVKKARLFSFLSAFVLACIDETIQFFVPGRDGRVTDVFIDASGAVIALAVIKLFDIMAFRKKQGTEN